MRVGQWEESVKGAEALNQEQARQLSEVMANAHNLYGTPPRAEAVA